MFGYDPVKRRCKRQSFCSKNLKKKITREDGYKQECISYCRIFFNENPDRLSNNQKMYNLQDQAEISLHEKRETDLNFELAVKIRNRTRHAFKSQHVKNRKKIQ